MINIKNKKIKIIVNYVVGPILFVWLSVSIYNQISNQKDIKATYNSINQNFGSQQWLLCLSVILLMFVNWGIETKKWQLLVKGIEKISFLKAYRAVFCGQAFAINTVNNLGEYVGRVLFLNEGNRLRGIALTMIGSLSQVIVTFFMGAVALFFSKNLFAQNGLYNVGLSAFWYNGLVFVLVTFTTLLVIVYFGLSWLTRLVEKIPFISKYAFLIQKVEDFSIKDLTKILHLSFLRYFVFVLQYIILLKVFQVNGSFFMLALLVSIMFLILAIVPSIALAELGLRGKVSLLLLGMLSTNSAGIVFCATAIWVINRLLPALAGSLFILGVRIFKR
jgi:Lysylphosphatidylglycerol synthase TM region